MPGIHTPTSQPIVFSEKVSRANLEIIVWYYYCDIRNLFLETFSSIFGENIQPPGIVFYDYEVDREIQGQKNIHIYYDRIQNDICISREILGNIGPRQNDNITTALGLYLLIAHEYGHAFEELGKLTMTNEQQETFADIFAGYVFRSTCMTQQLETRFILEAMTIFDELGSLCREIEEKHGTKNIDANEEKRIRNFLTGFMSTPTRFEKYIEQFAQTKTEIRTIRGFLLSILSR